MNSSSVSIEMIARERLVPSPTNPRKKFDPEKLKELAGTLGTSESRRSRGGVILSNWKGVAFMKFQQVFNLFQDIVGMRTEKSVSFDGGDPGVPNYAVVKPNAQTKAWPAAAPIPTPADVAVTTPARPKIEAFSVEGYDLVRSILMRSKHDTKWLRLVPGRFCVPEKTNDPEPPLNQPLAFFGLN